MKKQNFDLKVIEKLQAENVKLKEALARHKHTDTCWEYAVKTALKCGCYHCIADCTDSHKQALKEPTDGKEAKSKTS